jgi:CBS-domain-containing membrane protein
MHRKDLATVCTQSKGETERQLAWLETEIKHTAPQAVNVAPNKGPMLKASVPKRVSPAALPELVWSPVGAGFLMILVGVIAWLAGKPWLIPSLGPTAYLQAEMPAHPSTRFYNTVTGHLIGLAMGFVSVMVFNAWQSPSPLLDHQLDMTRVWASALALTLTVLLAFLFKASHPPAGATTLLVSLGALRTREDALNLIAGVLIVALLGQILRKLRLKTARTKPS